LFLAQFYCRESVPEGIAAGRGCLKHVGATIIWISATADESLLFEGIDESDHCRAVHADAPCEPLLGGWSFGVDERECGELAAAEVRSRELRFDRLLCRRALVATATAIFPGNQTISKGSTMYLITGATANIGRPFLAQLHDEGHDVRALVRDASRAELLPDGIDIAVGDLDDADSVAAALRGIDSVFLLHVGAGTTQTQIMIDAARSAGVNRIVVLSSIGARLIPLGGFIPATLAAREDLLRAATLATVTSSTGPRRSPPASRSKSSLRSSDAPSSSSTSHPSRSQRRPSKRARRSSLPKRCRTSTSCSARAEPA